MPTRFPDKFLERLDRVDPRQLKTYLQELISENRFLGNIIDRLEDGILILDKDARIMTINPQAELLLGVSGERLKNKRFDRCPLDTQIIKTIENALSAKKEYINREIWVTFPKEQLLKFLIVSVEDTGEPLGWIIELQDITEIKRTSSQRIQTEKLKALVTLAAGIAHELGNPLNSLGIHLQLINRELKKLPKKTKDRLDKPLAVVQTEIKRLDQIVSSFLQATRPLKPRFLVSHIRDVLDETLAFLSPELRKNRIEIDKKYYTEIPKTYLDYIQLRQAFMNIIKNAIEAMPNGGVLKIASDLKNAKIKISFKDNGIGIPEDKLDKIFEPYYTTKAKGSGLGLMTVHRAIREHGGYIEVNSKLGKGTAVTIYLSAEPRGPRLLPPGKKR